MNPHEHDHAHDANPTGSEPDALTDALTEAQIAEMERAIASLPLAQPTAMLDARVASALQASATTSPTETENTAPYSITQARRSRMLTGLAVAAVLALFAALGVTLYLQSGEQTTHPNPIAKQTPDDRDGLFDREELAAQDDPPSPTIAPVGYTFQQGPVKINWSRDIDQGLLTSTQGQPVRAIRRQNVEQEVWIDTERNVTVQITRPREHLVVVKQPTF